MNARRLVAAFLLYPATVFASACMFAPAELPDDQIDLFTMRALFDASSAYGNTVDRGLNVRTYDINGDGPHDLLVGDASASGNDGRALIYYGQSAGIGDYNVGAGGTGADVILAGTTNSQLGFDLALGDINGDGFADAIVSSLQANGTTGAVYVFYSEGAAGITSQNLNVGGTAGTTLTGENASDEFGNYIYVGDYNNDGFDDLLTAAPDYNSNAGRLYLFFGGPAGIESRGGAMADVIITGHSNFRFSQDWDDFAILADVDGDGLDDILSCGLNLGTLRGEMLVFMSNGGQANIDLGAGGVADAVLYGPNQQYCFGGLTAGDVNGDRYADILASDYDINGQNGQAYVYHGGPAGLTAESSSEADTILDGTNGCRFGIQFALADVTDDGLDDALIGERTGGCTPENYYMFYSSETGIASDSALNAASMLGDPGGSFVGYVGSGDYNGDGFMDLVTTRTSGGDELWIFYGDTNGIAGGTKANAGTTMSNITTASVVVPR